MAGEDCSVCEDEHCERILAGCKTIVNGVSKPVRNFNPHSGHRIQFQMAQASTRRSSESQTTDDGSTRSSKPSLIATLNTGKGGRPERRRTADDRTRLFHSRSCLCSTSYFPKGIYQAASVLFKRIIFIYIKPGMVTRVCLYYLLFTIYYLLFTMSVYHLALQRRAVSTCAPRDFPAKPKDLPQPLVPSWSPLI